MNIRELAQALPDFAKDIKLNLTTIMEEAGSPDLTSKQIFAIAIASAAATGNQTLTVSIVEEAQTILSSEDIAMAKAASSIMAMNNIYYRFTHTVTDSEFATMPVKLRMNVMAKPGVDKIAFELCSLAVSALNGCGKCMNAHNESLQKMQISKQAIQSAVRIAAVINATACSLQM